MVTDSGFTPFAGEDLTHIVHMPFTEFRVTTSKITKGQVIFDLELWSEEKLIHTFRKVMMFENETYALTKINGSMAVNLPVKSVKTRRLK